MAAVSGSVAKNAGRNLVQPISVGGVKASHRAMMAPLTRFRANGEGVHQDSGIEYYTQRASVPGTVLITEATFIRPEAGGYENVPGIWSDEQVAAWKKVSDAVHSKNSFLFLQAWALGRTAKGDVMKKRGLEVTGPSNIPMKDGSPVRALRTDEIHDFVRGYGIAAKNAQRAGFDGFEIHSANGYLIDQFLNEGVNNRTDEYGGSRENRIRFAKEVITSVVSAYGGSASSVGIRFSPWGQFQLKPMADEEARGTYIELVNWIKSTYPDFAYVHVVEPRWLDPTNKADNGFLRDAWGHERPFVRSGYSGQQGIEDAFDFADKENSTLIAFGRHFIANPDLPDRLKYGTALNKYDRSTFYGAGPQDTKGYTDYPFATEVNSTQ